MEYNICKICGAKDGRAGILVSNSEENLEEACMNCHDTRTSGNIVVHSRLIRTDEELQKTFDIIK